MRRVLMIYAALLLSAFGLMAVEARWGAFLLMAVLMSWFVHAVFASTGGTGRQL